jgi:hypothetical protein
VEHGELFYAEVNITCFGDILIFLKRELKNKQPKRAASLLRS